MAKKKKKTSGAKKASPKGESQKGLIMGPKGVRKLWCQFPYTKGELEKINVFLAKNRDLTLGDLAKQSIMRRV